MEGRTLRNAHTHNGTKGKVGERPLYQSCISHQHPLNNFHTCVVTNDHRGHYNVFFMPTIIVTSTAIVNEARVREDETSISTVVSVVFLLN